MSRKAAVGYPWRRIGAIEAEVSAMNMKLIVARSLALGLLMATAAWGQESPPTVIPPPAVSTPLRSSHLQTADLAGGCYWGTQGIFEHIQGITSIVAGFSAGHSDDDGGAESVMITYDPKVISYGRLLQIFFSVVHDPTQRDRQGPDVGRGYRSDIFYMNDAQRRIAQAYIQVEGVLQAHRDPCRCSAGIPPGRAESTGFHDQESAPGLHPDQRRTETGEPEAPVSSILRSAAAQIPLTLSRASSRTSDARTGCR